MKGLQSWVALFCFCLRACIPGMLSDYGLGALGRLVIQCCTLVSHLSPLVSTCHPLVSYSPAFRMMCLVCLNSTHPAALDRQRQETTTKQRGRLAAANIHQQHLPKEESKRKARAPTKDTKEQPKKGREGERTRKSKPGKTRSKTRSKRDANEIRALAAANSRKVKSEG